MNYEELMKRRAELVAQQQERQTKLAAITNQIRVSGLMPREKYKQCCDAQQQHKMALNKINEELRELRIKIAAAKAKYEEVCKSEKAESPAAVIVPAEAVKVKDMVEKLVALRGEYQAFAADFTRVSSMRQMAADFVLKINPIIRGAVNPDSQ